MECVAVIYALYVLMCVGFEVFPRVRGQVALVGEGRRGRGGPGGGHRPSADIH